MPNTNNTPFTWTDAQWLNTQITNCIDRSTQAVITAADALTLISNINRGTQLLSKTVGVNLNPTITLTYASLVNTFTVGSTITDANGSTATIVTDDGTSTMTLTNISLATGFETLSGAITESPGSATAVVNTFNWGDQVIALTGGNTFIITDIVLTNASAVPANASDTEWWGALGRTGINYANNSNLGTIISGFGSTPGSGMGSSGADVAPLPLANASQYMSITNGEITFVSQPGGNSLSTCGTLLYFTVGIPEGTSLTCDMYIYGYVLN